MEKLHSTEMEVIYDPTQYFSKMNKSLESLLDIYIKHIYQPFRSGRIWHKVNF